MNNLDFLIWLPFVLIAIIDFCWFMSIKPKQRHKHDAEAAGIFFLGLMISFVFWCVHEVYRQEGWESLKLKIADKTMFAIFGVALGAVIALSIIGLFAVLMSNQKKK